MEVFGFTDFASLPNFPFIGAAGAIEGFNSVNCGTCWELTFVNSRGASKSINILGVNCFVTILRDQESDYTFPDRSCGCWDLQYCLGSYEQPDGQPGRATRQGQRHIYSSSRLCLRSQHLRNCRTYDVRTMLCL